MGKRPDIENADKTIQVLFEISSVLNRTSTLGEMYKSIHKSLGKILNADNMYIALYHEDKDSITFPYYVDEIDKDFAEVFEISKKKSMIAKVINQKKALLATNDDLMRMVLKESGELVGTPCQIWIGAPLMIRGRAFGALALQSYTSRDMFKESDLTILSSVSEQIAMAVERKKEEEARKKSEEINSTLFEISNAVNTTRNLEQLCKSIHEALKKVIYIKNFSLSLYDKEIDQLNFFYHCDTTNPESIIKNVSKSASLTFEVIRTGDPLLLDGQGQKKLVEKLGGGMLGTLAKSWLCIPLKTNNGVIGAILTQDYTDDNRFSKKDIELLTIVSGQIALSIERKRAEDAENKSKEINRVMFAISNAVNTTENLYELYKSIHMTLGSVIDVTNFMIGIYDHRKDSISYPYFTDEKDDDYSAIQNVSTSGILASEIINRAKPFFITRDEIIERTKVIGARGLGVIPEQWFGVPLIIKKHVIGVIVVQSYSDPEHYGKKDVGILLSVSEQVAMAIERKQSEENIKQSEELTKTLFSISNAVNTTDNLDDLYRSIYNSLNTLIELPNFFIAIVDEEKKVMDFPFYRDEYDSAETIFFTVDNFEKRGTITTDVIKSKKALFLKKEELEKNAEQNKVVGTVSVIWLGIPLIIRDQVIGVMVVQHYSDPEYFTQKDMDLFIAVSDQIALAIDRKRSQEIIIEREKHILQLSRQTQEFSLVAASIISMKDEKEIFKHISKAIVKYSGFQRVLISLFKDEPPFRDIIAFEGVDKTIIDKLRKIEMPSSWYDAVFEQGEKIGLLTNYIPHTMKHILNQKATIFGKGSPPATKNCWHPEDNLFVEMRGQTGQLLGIISVDEPESEEKPTKETVRPLEIFSSLISQIMIFRKIQNELKDHKENLQTMVDDRTKELTAEIAERIQIESKLKKAKLEAEAAAKAKGEFLANMSHEIRTPINGIMGMTEIAMGKELDTDLRRILQTIDFEADSLLEIINQILDFSKIEAGKLILENIPFDLRNTFERACSLLTMGIKNKDIEFISLLAPDVPLKLIGDPGRLRQILLNLAGNAIKFTYEGEIFIKVENIREYKNAVEIRFIVKDTGIGIEKAKQKTIFDSFSQADGSTTRKYGGTGLGTTISKQLVELMGGKIGLESVVGKGSTFWFTIKFELQKEKIQEKIQRDINLNGIKVLVIDDNEANRFVLIRDLKSFGIEPVVAEDDKIGLQMIQQSSITPKPLAAIIISLKHSTIDGFELAAKIRQNKDFGKLPIIMLAYTGKLGDGQSCTDAGINAYLLKPFKQEELKQAITTALYNFSFAKEDNQQLITRHTIAEELHESLHILVVEDYATNQQIALKHLKSAGYQVTLAENGKIAVDMFKEREFDLILMDIQMSVMDGYQATKLIRGYESKISDLKIDDSNNHFILKNRIPIIAMTAHSIAGYKEKCLKAGMDDYISKPLRREKFLAMVAKWGPNNKRTSVPKRVNAPIDLALALKEFEGDKEFLLEIIDEFILNVDKQLPKIKKAISKNDAATLQTEAHSITGGASSLTAYNLSEIAHKLENMGASQNFANSSKVYKSFEKEFSRLKSFMVKSVL